MPRKTADLPVTDLLVDFKKHQRNRGADRWTTEQDCYCIRRVVAAYPRSHVLRLRTRQLQAWLDDLDVAAATKATMITRLRRFYRWAVEARHLRQSPAIELKRPKVRKYLPRPAPDSDLADALDAASLAPTDDGRLLAILSLMAYEGARCVEASRLRGEDVDALAMTVLLRGKGDKERVVPLHPHTLDALQTYRLPRRGPVFVPARGPETRPITPSYVSRLVSAVFPEGMTGHRLRHWFGTNFYRQSRDLLLTRDVMGHASEATTVLYAAADATKAAAVTNALSVGR